MRTSTIRFVNGEVMNVAESPEEIVQLITGYISRNEIEMIRLTEVKEEGRYERIVHTRQVMVRWQTITTIRPDVQDWKRI